MNYELKLFDSETATNAEFKARCDFLNDIRKETRPDDPAVNLEQSIKNIKSWKVFKDRRFEVWDLWIGKDIVAELFISIAFRETNKDLIDFEIVVRQEYRRQGIATDLVKKLISVAKEYNRTKLMTYSTSKIPAGAEFAKHFAADLGLKNTESRLFLNNLDQKLMQTWVDNAKLSAKEFEIGIWDSDYPEAEIVNIAKLKEVMNTAPLEDLEMEDVVVTPERIRQGEESMRKRGTSRWTYYARHKPSNELAGYTDIYWEPDNPKEAYQGETGVIAKYRGYRLGKWLKAAMVLKILKDKPDVSQIVTSNAGSNEYMLAINNAMGFEAYTEEQVWQIGLEQLETKLLNA